MIAISITPKVAVLQDQDRRHYAVPIALQRAGILDRVFTDWYTRPGSIESLITSLVRRVKPDRAKKMEERFAPELDATKVRSKPSLMLRQIIGRRKFRTDVDYHAWLSDLTARWVLDEGLGEANALYGFVRHIYPGLCATAKSYGLKVITDQMIAPSTVEHAEAVKQLSKYAAWSPDKTAAESRVLTEIERSTWESSDLITCMSEYVRDGLVQCGVDENKVIVVPYPVNSDIAPPIDRRGRSGPVVVGFVGQIGLRKGAPYFFEVARRLDPAKVKFVMVGPSVVDPDVLEQFRDTVELPGPAPRGEIATWMETFDIFLFPSTCEGSAGAVTEAMMAGLPVVTSPNSGSLVRHAIDGYVSTYDDVDRMAGYITTLAADQELRHQLGRSAGERAASFDLNWYGQRMKTLFTDLINERS